MNKKELFNFLLNKAEEEFNRVSYVKGSFKSGICVVRKEKNIFLNKNSNLDSNLRILVDALSESESFENQCPREVHEAINRYLEIEFST